MSRWWCASSLLWIACYGAQPAVGVPCGEGGACPGGQRCEVKADGAAICVRAGEPDPTAPDASAGDAPERGDASALAPANDRPTDAIDVSAGGTFTIELAGASDDVATSCAAGAGADVFFELELATPEVIYLDTFGSDANAVIAVHAGACGAMTSLEACVDDSCGSVHAQGAWNLPAGTHCIVVDHVGDAVGVTQLEVVRGGRDGDPLIGTSGTVSGDTCRADNSNDASCGCEPAEDQHYFFTVCPAGTMATIATCGDATWDTVLQFRNGMHMGEGCTDDSCGTVQSTLTRSLAGPGLFWAIVDGCVECGPYTLTYAL